MWSQLLKPPQYPCGRDLPREPSAPLCPLPTWPGKVAPTNTGTWCATTGGENRPASRKVQISLSGRWLQRPHSFLHLHRNLEKWRPLHTDSKAQHWLRGCSSQGCLHTFTIPHTQNKRKIRKGVKITTLSLVLLAQRLHALSPSAPRSSHRTGRGRHRREGPYSR